MTGRVKRSGIGLKEKKAEVAAWEGNNQKDLMHVKKSLRTHENRSSKFLLVDKFISLENEDMQMIHQIK